MWHMDFLHKASLNLFCCHCQNLLDMNTGHVIQPAIHLALPFVIFPIQVPSPIYRRSDICMHFFDFSFLREKEIQKFSGETDVLGAPSLV